MNAIACIYSSDKDGKAIKASKEIAVTTTFTKT